MRANGAMGVFIFFVISGYLITTLSLREESQRGKVSLKAFYIRRACRIFPLYYLVLFFYVVAVIGLNYHGHRALLMSAMPYYLTYMNDFAPEIQSMPYEHSWSLGVEEKFYFLWPFLAFVLWRGRTRLRVLGTLAIILAPLLLDRAHLLPFAATRYGNPLYLSYDAILVGCLLAFALHQPRSYAWLARLASGVPALLLLALFLVTHLYVFSSRMTLFAYPFTVALVMIPILLGRVGWSRWLESRAMVFVGVRSYGIYLVHLICLSVAGPIVSRLLKVPLDEGRIPIGPHPWVPSLAILALGVGSSVLVAATLTILIERPCIAFGRRRTRALTGADPIAPARMNAGPVALPIAAPSDT
jgi:peptidoglycan/LPS O-acetylase OafA/YrhL